MIDEKMYKILSNLDSEELSRRISEDELTEQGFEVASKILVERGQKIPNRTKQSNNSPDDSFVNSFKRFASVFAFFLSRHTSKRIQRRVCSLAQIKKCNLVASV